MSARDEILARIRANRPAAVPCPDVPTFERDQGDLTVPFRMALETMGGIWATIEADDLAQWVRAAFPDARVILSAVPDVKGTRALPDPDDPIACADVDVGIVRARFGVAETGSVWLSEAELGVNALGYLSQHLIVLLDPTRIVPNLHHAFRDPAWQEARYGVLHTGPSATADIEGVLIHGAQGIRSLTVIPLAPRAEATGLGAAARSDPRPSPPSAESTDRPARNQGVRRRER
jgi:L-lactate dehydrogenase complex protein LldG